MRTLLAFIAAGVLLGATAGLQAKLPAPAPKTDADKKAEADKAAATKEFKAQQSVIDRIADKKVVHKNTASRNKTRLAQAIKALP